MYPEVALDNRFARNLTSLKTVVRIIFGILWAIDGALKFAPGFVDSFSSMIKGCGIRTAIMASRVVFILGINNIFESRILCVLVRTSRTRSCPRYYLWILAYAFVH